jgi:hypothetical protein
MPGHGESILRDARSSAAIRFLAFGVRSGARKGVRLDMFVVWFGLSGDAHSPEKVARHVLVILFGSLKYSR